MSRISNNINSISTSSLVTMNRLNNTSLNNNNNNKLNNDTNRDEDQQHTVIELNVGGVYYATTMATLLSENDSIFTQLFSNNTNNSTDSSLKVKDSKNKYFFDRDGLLFRYVLDYLRNKCVTLPENFNEKRRLKQEAEYFKLANMVKAIEDLEHEVNPTLNLSSLQLRQQHQAQFSIDYEKERTTLSLTNSIVRKRNPSSGSIVIGYRGTFAFGREGLSDVKFRKISRILVCGRVQLCRDVFGDALNESRDPDHGVSDRYTSRFFLKHTFLEQAFDTLTDAGFFLVGTCATGTNSPFDQFNKAASDSEESRWLHYNEFIFYKA